MMLIFGQDIYNHLCECISIMGDEIPEFINALNKAKLNGDIHALPYMQFTSKEVFEKETEVLEDPDGEMALRDGEFYVYLSWDPTAEQEIMNDLYGIEKGIRNVALEAIPMAFKHDAEALCSVDYPVKTYQFIRADDDCPEKDKWYRFFIYNNASVLPILEMINNSPYKTQEALLGLLLKYDPEDVGGFVNAL